MLFRTKKIFILFASLFILTACGHQKTPTEKMYDVLENVVKAEDGFDQQQDPLVALEKKEKGIYDKIIGLGMKQYDEIVKLSNEAIQSADDRASKMKKETDSIKESKAKFKEVANIKDTLEKPKLKKLANQLYSIMLQRYEAHDILYKKYMIGVDNDKKLYEMFKEKNLSLEDLESQVNTTNKVYQEIYNANDKFNQLTNEYNKSKLQFYKEAGFKINKKK
ncbi:MAG: YkyA family protein [Bacillota bacterium]|nr:YkyA family protein [Bacillota bacterium]